MAIKEKTVTIMIPKTKSETDDVFVSVNMDTYQIQRGVPVDVPASVAEVLQHQQEMIDKIVAFDEAHGN